MHHVPSKPCSSSLFPISLSLSLSSFLKKEFCVFISPPIIYLNLILFSLAHLSLIYKHLNKHTYIQLSTTTNYSERKEKKNMSCNGCRVLRKGCSDTCILRPCLQWMEIPEAQGHATVFLAKFFGRAGLMSFISAVPESQRPALFQSLLFEAAGRTVNPVNGAVGLLWTGNWHVCQAAVETVLRGGALRPIPEFLCTSSTSREVDEASECTDMFKLGDPSFSSRSRVEKRRPPYEESKVLQLADLDLSLTQGFPAKVVSEKRREETPSRNSEESVTTTGCFESGFGHHYNNALGGGIRAGEAKFLNLF